MTEILKFNWLLDSYSSRNPLTSAVKQKTERGEQKQRGWYVFGIERYNDEAHNNYVYGSFWVGAH